MIIARKLAITVWFAGMAFSFSEPAAKPPQAGENAPAFKLQGSDGKVYSLEQFAGKQAVVVAWFPKAFTGG